MPSPLFDFQCLPAPDTLPPTTFTCTLLSPMFMLGADNTTPELREESFIGVMHYWYRALWGHRREILNRLRKKEKERDVIKEYEDALFGSTAQAGRAWIALSDSKNIRPGKASYKPHRAKSDFVKEAFISGTFKATVPAEIADLFELSCILGGFGGHSRRGFGAVCCQRDGFSNLNACLIRLMVLLKSFFESCDLTFTDCKEFNAKRIAFPDGPSFNEFPYIKNIYLGNKGDNSVQELLKEFDKTTVELKKQHDKTEFANQMGALNSRYASPIIASIVKIGAEYYPIITQLHGTESTLTNIQEEYIKAVLNA